MTAIYRNKIYEWQGDTTQPYPNDFTWKSKIYLFSFVMTFNCARIISVTGDRQDYYDSLIAYNRVVSRNNERIPYDMGGAVGESYIGEDIEVNGDYLEELEAVADYSGDFNLTMYFYVDETLHFTKEIYSTDKPFRIPGGLRGRKFEIQIEGNVTVKRIDLATSIQELMQ